MSHMGEYPAIPSAWDAVANPTAYRRWRDAVHAGRAVRDCGCPDGDPHESHCDHWLRYVTT